MVFQDPVRGVMSSTDPLRDDPGSWLCAACGGAARPSPRPFVSLTPDVLIPAGFQAMHEATIGEIRQLREAMDIVIRALPLQPTEAHLVDQLLNPEGMSPAQRRVEELASEVERLEALARDREARIAVLEPMVARLEEDARRTTAVLLRRTEESVRAWAQVQAEIDSTGNPAVVAGLRRATTILTGGSR